jgi:mannose-1-phosphate guanylyltransferase
VKGFRERPEAWEAERLLRNGGVWNTMVMVAQCRALWFWGGECFPGMMQKFEEFALHIGTGREQAVLEALYEELPVVNFSSGLLEKAPEASVVMELEGVLWSDWGNERRIAETLRGLGKSPSFGTVEAGFHTAAPSVA